MATVEYWIQIENRPWDTCPYNIDRMSGQSLKEITKNAPVEVTVSDALGGTKHKQKMYNPLSGEALILRRYLAPDLPNFGPWARPDDRKVNPWDLNEPDPTDQGTMGTIPGPVIECNVGDKVIIHFSNQDWRTIPVPTGAYLPVEKRTHSLHPHGFLFAPASDGAYPLSPPDPNQPIENDPNVQQLWASVGANGPFKQGDRVPPGMTFDYTWTTGAEDPKSQKITGWPSTAGVWLYHDHSICDTDSVGLGAIGIVVIHNPADPDDLVVASSDLPEGSYTGNPLQLTCSPLTHPMGALPFQLAGIISAGTHFGVQGKVTVTPPSRPFVVKLGNLMFELSDDLTTYKATCFNTYRQPPSKAQYVLLFHKLTAAGMCINGRKFMGNTPTLLAGPQTQMRFGVVGMGDEFHTFHIHGHRWVIPGPDGSDPSTIQNSTQVRAVSQFEDTKIFGPANSFVFTMKEGDLQPGKPSFLGPPPGEAVGEWHLHCHVLMHMDDGMMGSLLIVNGGELAGGLPSGVMCPPMPMPAGPPVEPTGSAGDSKGAVQVSIHDSTFDPPNVMVKKGQAVVWTNNDVAPHTVTSNNSPNLAFANCSGSATEAFDSRGSPPTKTMLKGDTFQHTFQTLGTHAYHCEVHGCTMAGTVMVMVM